MQFFRRLFNRKARIPKQPLQPTPYEVKHMLGGIGEVQIESDRIRFLQYPFEPSVVFPANTLMASEIHSICPDGYPPMIRVGEELIFISRVHHEALKAFAQRNQLMEFTHTRNWNHLLEPFLDTEYTPDWDRKMTERLMTNGISPAEIRDLRTEVKELILAYNFDTGLMDWANLGLSDVLAAVQKRYDRESFQRFFQRAMEIELRQGPSVDPAELDR
ncbi:hypothetical protein [Pontibacter sp. G13]|uniref:hypothetical protein n=1 Tax=Pontibacter sp. G13 TaxID=3074898 RepID=UPI00288C4C62|nr:hypothetical protein [Pontibacter sp. G13]WNJ20559.1 hypothetical protein RJD25_08755 [Pontibacter sp. G13]